MRACVTLFDILLSIENGIIINVTRRLQCGIRESHWKPLAGPHTQSTEGRTCHRLSYVVHLIYLYLQIWYDENRQPVAEDTKLEADVRNSDALACWKQGHRRERTMSYDKILGGKGSETFFVTKQNSEQRWDE